MRPRLAGRAVAGISFELASARDLPDDDSALHGLTGAQRSVFSWLARHRDQIVEAEQMWRVDRRAIACAITWEALENLAYFSPRLIGCGRASGPGKVHYKSNLLLGEGRPVAKQVESAGYLPPLSVGSRKRYLRTGSGAITYIGAIMCAYADIGIECGFERLRAREDLILTQPYQGVRRVGDLGELESWRLALQRHQDRGTELDPQNPMYLWVNVRRNCEFIEAAVGRCPDRAVLTGYRGPVPV